MNRNDLPSRRNPKSAARLKRRDFLKSASAVAAAAALPAPAVWSPAKAQSRQETLLVVTEYSPNNFDIHGVGTNRPGLRGVVELLRPADVARRRRRSPTARKSYDRDKFTPELAEDWNATDTSVTFKLRKDAKFHDGTPITAKDVKWSFDRAVTVGGFPTFQMKAGSLEKPEQFVAVDDHTFRVDFIRKDKLTMPDLAVIVPAVYQLRAGQEERHREGPLGPRVHQDQHRRRRRLQGVALAGRAPRSCSSATTTGRAGRCRRSSASSGARCRRPATGAR